MEMNSKDQNLIWHGQNESISVHFNSFSFAEDHLTRVSAYKREISFLANENGLKFKILIHFNTFEQNMDW